MRHLRFDFDYQMIFDMKWNLLFSILLIALLSSCAEEEGFILNHDGDNFSAPFLPAGTHITAAKFENNDLDRFEGRFLEEIHFYIVNVPANAVIEVYGEGGLETPGPLIMSVDIGNNMAPQQWNAYILDQPIEITGEELWICITVTHNVNNNSVGCDPGPAVQNGDWLLAEDSPGWETLREYTSGATSINWNIRGIMNQE